MLFSDVLLHPDPHTMHLFIQQAQCALSSSTSKPSSHGEAPLCKNKFGIQSTQAHPDLWYCNTTQVDGYYHNSVQVHFVKTTMYAIFDLFLRMWTLQLSSFPSSAKMLLISYSLSCPFCLVCVIPLDFCLNYSSVSVDQTAISGFLLLSVSRVMYWHSQLQSVVSIIYTLTVLWP